MIESIKGCRTKGINKAELTEQLGELELLYNHSIHGTQLSFQVFLKKQQSCPLQEEPKKQSCGT
jgi:hypothetical protein